MLMEYRLTLSNLPTSVRGYVYLEEDGVPRIVLNANLTREQNLLTLKHEVEHIERGDVFDPTYNEYGTEE